ncbi:MAG: hypothetical protein PHD10_01390 [Bacilli bacterium]|nr:hypothetical protein [Bacilli bacterium]MDD4607776.1 hypothetical protein [Bacilli bacterium]
MEIVNKEPVIYIICGKARAGKDTISEIIKEYYEKNNKKVLNLQYSSYIKDYAKKISDWDGSEEKKPRALLQQLGTEIIRFKIDMLFFVKRICSDIQVYSYFFDCLTISDARTKEEVDVPKEKFNKVVAIHVDRPNFDNGLTEEQRKHFTEIELDDYDKYDYKIINDGDLEQLKEKVEVILRGIENEY